jgi:hypothetical protein
MTLRFLSLISGFVLSGLAVSAQEYRLIRERPLEAGTKMREAVFMEMSRLDMSMKAGDEVLSRSRFTGEGEEVNDIEWRGADEVVVKVGRNRFSTVLEAEGEAAEKDTESESLEGCTVVGKRRDGAWNFTLAEGTATEKQAKDLKEMGKTFESDDNLYPKEAIRIGHQWTVRGAALRGLLGSSEMENLGGELEAKLVGIEKHEGMECARIAVAGTVTFDMSMDDDDEEDEGEEEEVEMTMPAMKASLQLKGDVLRSLEHGLDVLADLTGTLGVTGRAEAAGMEFHVGMKGPVILKATVDLSANATELPLPGTPAARAPRATPKNSRSID